jgi:hypothetical protein
MSDGRKYYCLCDSNCKFETMTKEQILAAITQAVETGKVGDVDTGFVTKLKEKNGGNYVTVWVGTQAQYNALAAIDANCLYIITDDTTSTDFAKATEDFAAANAAFEAHLNDHDEVEIIQSSDNTVYKKYKNGIAEGWFTWYATSRAITKAAGGLYVSEAVDCPYPYFVKDSLAAGDAPLVCDAVVTGTSSNDNPVFLMSAGSATTEHGQKLIFASTKSVTTSVLVQLHYVWRWNDNSEVGTE